VQIACRVRSNAVDFFSVFGIFLFLQRDCSGSTVGVIFLTLHAKSMWWEVNVFLFNFLYFSENVPFSFLNMHEFALTTRQ